MRGDKTERILRVMLNENKKLSKNELSKRAGCSRRWVSLFLKKLEEKNLAKGTAAKNRKSLIKYWLNVHKKPKKYREYMVREPLAVLEKSKMDYALTTYQAENIVQRHLFPSRVDLYIKAEDLDEWHNLMLKHGLYGKGNVRIIPYDAHVMYGKRKLNNLFIVSIPQLAIDLFTEGGPCAEAAEMLLEKL
ncbi:MAG: Lrp/AsnC family transcriptional regulator [Nanoarchaeota archaeon]